MTIAQLEWVEAVERAASAGDQAALSRLYADGKPLFGDLLAHEWSEALSAFDASAVTG